MSVAGLIQSTEEVILVFIFAFMWDSCTLIAHFACSKVIQSRIVVFCAFGLGDEILVCDSLVLEGRYAWHSFVFGFAGKLDELSEFFAAASIHSYQTLSLILDIVYVVYREIGWLLLWLCIDVDCAMTICSWSNNGLAISWTLSTNCVINLYDLTLSFLLF